MGSKDKGKNKYPDLNNNTDIFGVGAVRMATTNTTGGGGSGNTGSCGVNVSCILCCCIGSGGGAEHKKIYPNV
ncbi:hypothetical protein [Paenibacillus tepidiphilus]|uniref:hypothetical protein n=1 Tax=Paenibacillus tepidiphilus TaxID=2608683 RepID=UPI001239794A|nr:hypothetical protein [Paenibacillus tepidiphilus]